MAPVSDLLTDRLHLRLTPEDCAWFDEEWQTISGSEMSFNEAINPEEISDSIWGGLMPPDTLPIAGNGCGDCLLARFGQNGALNEVIAWYHEGGGWTHFGTTIHQAVTLDQAMYPSDLEDSAPPTTLPATVSNIAACEHACKQELGSQLLRACRKHGGGKLAKDVGVDWRMFRTWLHDPSLIPGPILKKLADHVRISAHDLARQNWSLASEHAQTVIALRPDLAWPFAVTGWAHERVGAIGRSIGVYASGVFAPGSSASFTETWTRDPDWSLKKFCVHRLLVLAPQGLPTSVQDYLNAASENNEREYWMNRAALATKAGNHQEAYHSLYAAGWDAFSTNDKALLQMIADAAGRAHSPALQAIANVHLQRTLH